MIVHAYVGPVRYYRALASYDPSLQSPNEDGAEQELAFSVDDVIVVSVICFCDLSL